MRPSSTSPGPYLPSITARNAAKFFLSSDRIETSSDTAVSLRGLGFLAAAAAAVAAGFLVGGFFASPCASAGAAASSEPTSEMTTTRGVRRMAVSLHEEAEPGALVRLDLQPLLELV